VAWRQSTCPLSMGITPDRKASAAETVAMGIARRVTQRTPHRLTARKNRIRAVARARTGTPGRYHSWSAVAESRAVTPQVGTQPHQ